MAKFIFLSHVLTADTPGYGGVAGFAVEQIKSITQECSVHSSKWTLSNHIGTHIDVPFHFSNQGETVESYPADFWIFKNPYLIDYQAHPSELIEPGFWIESIPQVSDLLLLRTGFETLRSQCEYWEKGPGLSPELGSWLRAHRPQVRAIGFDFISVTSWQNRPTGRNAHLALLDPNLAGHPLVVIEDMALAGLKCSPNKVIVSPIRVGGADGSPATIFADRGGS